MDRDTRTFVFITFLILAAYVTSCVAASLVLR
jgi:hypothetical protein